VIADKPATVTLATGCDTTYSNVMRPDDALRKVRAACLALDDVTERLSHGQPAWFVGKKQFAVLTNNHHGDGMLALTVGAPPGMQRMLVDSDPEIYKVPPYVGSKGWVLIRLDRDLPWKQVRALIEAACSANRR